MKGIVGLTFIIGLLFVSASYAAQEKIISKFSGNTSVETETFTTDGPWVILYIADGPIEIVVRKKDGAFDNTAIQSIDAGSKGSSKQGSTGTYYLDVDAYKPWHIQIRMIQ